MGQSSHYVVIADQLFSKIVRSRGVCEHCGGRQSSTFQCAHVIGRDNKALRWNANNALNLCDPCHRWAHANPKLFMAWFENKYPDRYAYIMLHKNDVWQLKWYDYEELIKTLRSFL